MLLASITICYQVYTYSSITPAHIVVNLTSTHQNVIFTKNTVYFLNGVAYDFYSIDELINRTGPGSHWKTFPLPQEHSQSHTIPRTSHHHQSNSSVSTTDLAFVDHIYVTTTSSLTDRHMNLKRMFTQYQITNYEWRMKWRHDSCDTPENKNEAFRKLNIRVNTEVSTKKKRQCAITMEHVDIWHDIVARNSSLSLILEDDAVFVSNFREKFERTIHTAIRTGLLKMGGLNHCLKDKVRLSKNSNERVEQDPVIVIGSCMGLVDEDFAKNRRDAPPRLSTHKEMSSRCTHAYLLTACSAQALLKQIAVRKNTFMQSDLLLNMLVDSSPTLQSVWLDPPIVYQGNRIIDLDGIPSFQRTTY